MKKLMRTAMALFLAAGFAVMGQEEAATKAEPTPKAPAAAPQRPARPFPGPNGERRGGPGMMNQEAQIKRFNEDAKQIVEMYDADKDGKLNAEERAKMDADFAVAEKLMRYTRTKSIIDALDADKDMQISEAEAKNLPKAMREIMQKRMGQNGAPGRNGRPPQMGGRPQRPERPANQKGDELPPPPPPKAEEPKAAEPPAEQPAE